MNILITGGSGFIGANLCSCLSKDGHDITGLTRSLKKTEGEITWINSLDELKQNASFDIVINLAGEPIGDKRWTEKQKVVIIQSRIEITRKLVEYFKKAQVKPELFISGSAIGYYGVYGSTHNVSEEAKGDESFSSQLCMRWETEARKAEKLNIRTCLLRTGIVLGKNGGVLKKLLLVYKWGLGGKIGTGKQWMPWIHVEDMIGILRYCIEQVDLSGPINCTAPRVVTNKKFSNALAKALNRPSFFPLPERIVRLLMGQMGEELLLAGKQIIPNKILRAGYVFKYKDLDVALADIVRSG